jgi:hypothetical protein
MVEKPISFFPFGLASGGSHTVTLASSRADMQYDSVFKTAACNLTKFFLGGGDGQRYSLHSRAQMKGLVRRMGKRGPRSLNLLLAKEVYSPRGAGEADRKGVNSSKRPIA